jgi:hypothetical protein
MTRSGASIGLADHVLADSAMPPHPSGLNPKTPAFATILGCGTRPALISAFISGGFSRRFAKNDRRHL